MRLTCSIFARATIDNCWTIPWSPALRPTRQVRAGFRVASGSLQDRVTRFFAGDRADMTFTSWSGTLVFATA